MTDYRISITALGDAAFAALSEKYKIKTNDHGTRRRLVPEYRVDAFVEGDAIKELQEAGYALEIHGSAADIAGASTKGQPPADASETVKLATAGYLSVQGVEDALINAAARPFQDIAQLICLPHPTWEGRRCHAIKLGIETNAPRPGLYLLGGVHGSEWGSCDILINFMNLLEHSWYTRTDVSFGPDLSFSAGEVRSIIETLDVIIFPQANPDGRHFSMTSSGQWRKNRRTEEPNSEREAGVDINRNFDFLWDYHNHFAQSANLRVSDKVYDLFYRGPHPESEPETKNIVALFDQFENIGFFVDLHSYGQKILYCWADDEIQTSNPAMSFMSRAGDNVRGIEHDKAYAEYMPRTDHDLSIELAECIQRAIKDAGGPTYRVDAAISNGVTGGMSTDYAYSRHFTDNMKNRIISHIIEWGVDVPHPPYAVMQQIIPQVTAGLFALALRIVRT